MCSKISHMCPRCGEYEDCHYSDPVCPANENDRFICRRCEDIEIDDRGWDECYPDEHIEDEEFDD